MKDKINIDLDQINRIYFIGIGGIGMSAIARYFHQSEKQVAGYDKTKTNLTKKLEEEGIKISYKDQIEILDKDADLVIYTPAIPADHKGFNWYKAEMYPLYKRAEILAMISHHRKSICIAGTHGKTSTSSMVAYILRECGVDVSAFIGGIPTDYGTNFLFGDSDWVVMEADEYDRSFWQLSPDIASIMSTDADHLDIYGSHDVMQEGFEGFAHKINDRGLLLVKHPLQNDFSKKLLDDLDDRRISIKSFGVEEGDIYARDVKVENGQYTFDYISEDIDIYNLTTQMPGVHNVHNALVAISIAVDRGCEPEDIREALANFSGIKRRFETFYRDENFVMIDDYAHHPTELNMAIDAARNLYPNKKLTGIFQPHLFTRTRDFQNEFGTSLSKLDEVILLPIYPAREKPIEGITSNIILEKINIEDKILLNKKEVINYLKNKDIEVLMILGAGDIYTLPNDIIEWKKEN